MQLLWNKSLNKQNFPINRGIFRTNPEDIDTRTGSIYGKKDVALESYPNAVQVETAETARQVENITSQTASYGAIKKERNEKKRSGGNVMGVFLGTEFERQWINPAFWLRLTLFSKDSFIKNLEKSSDYYRDMLSGSEYLMPNIDGALFDKTFATTIKLISRGGGIAKENSSLFVFENLQESVLQSFDQALDDARAEKSLGQQALKSREKFRKIRDLSFWREARHRGMLDAIIRNLQKARKEVSANINLVRRKFTEDLQNTQASVSNYENSLEIKNDNTKSKNFWKFIEGVSYDPARFLSSPTAFGLSNTEIKKVFGTDNRYRVMDTVKMFYTNRVVEMQKSKYLATDMSAQLKNFDERERFTQENISDLEFMSIYENLQSGGLENYKKPVNDNEFVNSVRKALRQCNVLVENIFPEASVRLSDSEKILYLVKYLNQHPNILDNPKFPIVAKQKILRYFFDIISHEEGDFVAGGFEDEGTTNFLRKYVLTSALQIKGAANEALAALGEIQHNIRDFNASNFQDSATRIKSFITLYDQFLGLNGQLTKKQGDKPSMLEKLPKQEQEAVRSLLALKDFRDILGENGSTKSGIYALIQEREQFDAEVISNLPPGATEDDRNEIINNMQTRLAETFSKMEDSLGTDAGWEPGSHKALAEMYDKNLALFEKWQKATVQQQGFNFQHFIEPSHFQEVFNLLGQDLESLRDNVPQAEINHEINRSHLLVQHFQNKIQSQRETEFSESLHYNMERQSQIINNPETKINKGTNFAKITVANISQTDGQLDFPEVLNERIDLQNLSVVRKDAQGNLILQDQTGQKAFLLEKTTVMEGETPRTRLHLKMWKRTPTQQGVNTAFILSPSVPADKVYSVLNILEGDSSHWVNEEGRDIQKSAGKIRSTA